MEPTLLCIKGTEDTPEIIYNPDSNELAITGRSLPEDVTSFYEPVFKWLDEYPSSGKETTNFAFKLEYFNTASSKIILDILLRLEDILQEGNQKPNVTWHYADGDDDMLEAGEEYKELVEVPFNLKAY
jgi:hypothetical protein